MTVLQQLKEKLRDAKISMRYHKPTIGFLGSQYYYWESVRDNVLRKIEFHKTK